MVASLQRCGEFITPARIMAYSPRLYLLVFAVVELPGYVRTDIHEMMRRRNMEDDVFFDLRREHKKVVVLHTCDDDFRPSTFPAMSVWVSIIS